MLASISPILRDGLEKYKNKIVIGLSSCKVYDRSQTKRCNNCQHYGHFAKECPTPEEPVCGKCGGNHRTDGCNSGESKCINCLRKNCNDANHAAYDHICPTLKAYEKDFAERNGDRSLNMHRRGQINPT